MAVPCFENLAGKRVFIETYGCRYNFGDTAKLVEILRHRNCTIVLSDEHADAVIINTCTVVASTERRMLRRLSHFKNRELYVTGCLPVVQREKIMAVCNPAVIHPQEIRECYPAAGTVSPSPVGIIQIAGGCSGQCTYCIARIARGPLRSFAKKDILSQVNEHARLGSAEIQLTAQDVGAWGRDTGTTLPELLNVVGELDGNFFIRIGMMNPATVIDIIGDLVQSFSHDNLFKFIHIPVQSGSDNILRRMGRDYTVQDFEYIVAAFRKKFPDITLATDMIVGFPGETEDDFLQSLALIDRVRPNKVNVTRFSKRPFTPVFCEKDVPDATKKDRSRAMNLLAEKVYHEINSPYLGRTVPFIVTEQIRKGSVMARTPSYLGIVLKRNLPIGFTGQAVIRKEHRYFFFGQCCT